MIRYTRDIPLAWKGLALLCYAADLFGLGVLLPFAVWTLYPRSFFLRAHALSAGLVQAVGLAVAGLLHGLNLFFVFESEAFATSYLQFFGTLLRGEEVFTALCLALFSGVFFFAAIAAAQRLSRPGLNRQRYRQARELADRAPVHALLAMLFVNLVAHNEGLWSAGPVDGGAGGANLFADIFKAYADPLLLFPGYPVALWCAFLGLYALRGEVFWLRPARRLFARFALEERARLPASAGAGVGADGGAFPGRDALPETEAQTGPAFGGRGGRGWRAAKTRALLLPGWGQFFLGRRAAGLAAFCAFLLFLLYFVISFGLVYGDWIKNVPGLNANFTWYFLSGIGLRSQLADAAFKGILGHPLMAGGLVLGLGLLYLYSYRATAALYFGRSGAGFLTHTSPSLLLHLAPLAMLFVIPIGFDISRPTAPPRQQEKIEPIPIIPEFFEKPKNKFETGGGAYSGNEAEKYTPGAAGETPREGGPDTVDSTQSEVEGPGPFAKKQQRAIGGRPGDRQDLTYSNYISAKIRGPEIAGDYWDRMPRPYAVVVEYKIGASGRLFDVRVLEPSGHDEADRLTVKLIESMGHLLPPPGGEPVVVTELFWNTEAADENLPSERKRQLSRAFDGRVFQPY